MCSVDIKWHADGKGFHLSSGLQPCSYSVVHSVWIDVWQGGAGGLPMVCAQRSRGRVGPHVMSAWGSQRVPNSLGKGWCHRQLGLNDTTWGLHQGLTSGSWGRTCDVRACGVVVQADNTMNTFHHPVVFACLLACRPLHSCWDPLGCQVYDYRAAGRSAKPRVCCSW